MAGMATKILRACLLVALMIPGMPANAQDTRDDQTGYGTYGLPSLIDMPTATMAPDAELSFTGSVFEGNLRSTMTFQITPWVMGSFRYSAIDNAAGTPAAPVERLDRSFDLRFQLADEGAYRPALAMGLQDFVGTGFYSAEYVVASKHVTPQLQFSVGMGWGRLASRSGFTNPLGIFGDGFKTRDATTGVGGTLNAGQWFQGDAALFGGVSWAVTDRLTAKLEYSSDAYDGEVAAGELDPETPWNIGVNYRIGTTTHLSAFYMHGDRLGVAITTSINPNRPRQPGTVESAPPAVHPRPAGAYDQGWEFDEPVLGSVETALRKALSEQGMIAEAIRLDSDRAEIRLRNLRYDATPQAIGRAARVMANTLPSSIEVFRIIPVYKGLALAGVTLARSDVETLVHDPDGAWKSYVRAKIDSGTASRDQMRFDDALYRKLFYGVQPYYALGLFDPDAPVRADIGVEAFASYELIPGVIASGSVRQKVIGNLATANRPSDSVLPRVRSESAEYAKAQPSLANLTVSGFFRPGENLYGRATLGYLEPQFGGLSTELLWKRPDSRWALGLELNYAKQRNFDQGFGFRQYDVFTGHASAYYDFANGYHMRVDAGRYLAGDWGATLALDREFANGWRIGAYATLTDVSFEDFGEGSFDKGIILTMPLSWYNGAPNRNQPSLLLQPILRDGGAKLSVRDRLYEVVRDYHDPDMRETWGRIWR